MRLSEWFIGNDGKIYRYTNCRNPKRRGYSRLSGAINYKLKWKYVYSYK